MRAFASRFRISKRLLSHSFARLSDSVRLRPVLPKCLMFCYFSLTCPKMASRSLQRKQKPLLKEHVFSKGPQTLLKEHKPLLKETRALKETHASFKGNTSPFKGNTYPSKCNRSIFKGSISHFKLKTSLLNVSLFKGNTSPFKAVASFKGTCASFKKHCLSILPNQMQFDPPCQRVARSGLRHSFWHFFRGVRGGGSGGGGAGKVRSG